MRLFFNVLILSSLLGAPLAAEEDLYTLGQSSCEAALSGEIEGFIGADYEAAISQSGADQAAVCSCVGQNFAEFDPELAADLGLDAEFTEALDQTIAHCIEGSEDEGDPMAPEAAAYRPEDLAQCEAALSGQSPLAGFSKDAVLAQMQKAGQSTEALCLCTAEYLFSISDQLESPPEAQSSPRYGEALFGAMSNCLGG